MQEAHEWPLSNFIYCSYFLKLFTHQQIVMCLIVQDMPYLDLCSHQTISVNPNPDDEIDSADDVSLHSVSSSQVSDDAHDGTCCDCIS